MRGERDLPEGHPSASDYVPGSEAAKRYQESIKRNLSELDLPVGHPRRPDSPGFTNASHPLATARDYSRPHTVEKPAAAEEE